jgi:hypothetical protein
LKNRFSLLLEGWLKETTMRRKRPIAPLTLTQEEQATPEQWELSGKCFSFPFYPSASHPSCAANSYRLLALVDLENQWLLKHTGIIKSPSN